ncbi:hypothetical protein LVY75_35300 (plasmid) [Sinorhizobium sp. B11]
MKPYLGTGVALIAAVTNAEASYWTGYDLRDACQRTPSFVTGYVTGWADKRLIDSQNHSGDAGDGGSPKVCMSSNPSATRLTTTYCRYLAEHPDKLPEPAESLLADAFVKAFPCPQ